MLTIGFVTENYHTEVAEYLLEIFSDNTKYKTIFYNSHDNYLNWNIYKNRFPNLTRKPIHMFLPDINNDVCDKYFIITYENLFTLKALLHYKEKLIIICHIPRNIHECIEFKYDHITLTPFLLESCYSSNSMWTLPFLQNKHKIQDMVTIYTDKKRKNNGKIKLLSIGAFDDKNKDVNKVIELLENKNVELHVFLMTISDLVKSLVEKYDNMIVFEKISSNGILEYIEKTNIQYVLYTPNPESGFLSVGQWSGSIALGYSHDLPVIIPKKIANQNKLFGCISYEPEDKIYDKIFEYESGEPLLKMKELYDIKELNYQRNKLIIDILLNKIQDKFVYTNFGSLFIKNHMTGNDISKVDYISPNALKYLYESNSNENKIVVYYGSMYGVENLMINKLMNNKHNTTILSVDNNLEFCKLQKYTNLINFYNNIKVYNNNIGKQNIQSEPDTITIDNLIREVIDENNLNKNKIIIHINNSHDIENILEGSKKSISKCKPIFVFDKSIDLKQCKILSKNGYKFVLVDNRLICVIE